MRIAPLLVNDVIEIARADPQALREGLSGFHAADLAELLDEMDREDRVTVMQNLDAAKLGETLVYAGGESVKLALTRVPSNLLAPALDGLEPDDAVALLSFLPEERRAPLLAAMSAGHARTAANLLTYRDGTAGRLMTDKFVRIAPEWTVAETLEHLHRVDPEVATVADLYAINDNGVLVGVISLRKLLPKPGDVSVRTVMTTEIVFVQPEAIAEEATRLVAKYGFSALPVVDADHRMLGVITVDDVVDLLVKGGTQAALRMGGIAAEDEPWSRGVANYFGTSIFRVVRMRIGWLLLLFVAETMTGSVLRFFEDELARVVSLSFFIPLIIGTGGNAGSQTVSTIIRALALGQIQLRDGWRVLLRETTSGLVLGGLLCVVAIFRTLLWKTGVGLSLVVGLTILAVCAWANIIGAIVPLVAQRFKIDPTVVSAPLITTLVDASGLAIYMLIAKVVLNL
jgi:magnesium transporter